MIKSLKDKTLVLGDFYCNENLEQEHKEFTFNKIRNNFSNKLIFSFYRSLHWTDNIDYLVIKNIKTYLTVYLPKYLTSFNNSNINGNLNFGINDWGILTGIPFKNDLSKQIKHLEQFMNQIIKKQVSINGNKLTNKEYNNIIKNISIKVIKLNDVLVNNFEEVNLTKKINNYCKERKLIQSKLNYIKKRELIWKQKMDKYKSLVSIMTNLYTSKQLYNYIRENVQNDQESQAILKNYWKYARNFTLPEHNLLQKDKKNPKKVLYWLVTFKDVMVEKLCKQKPKFSELKQNVNKLIANTEKTNPIKLFYKLTPITKHLLKDNIHYYIIKININSKNIPYHKLMYREPFIYDDSWKIKKRIFNDNIGPCCV